MDENPQIAAIETRVRAKEDAPVESSASRRWWQGERGQRTRFLLFLLGPTVVIVLAVVAYPFFYNVVLSLSNMNLYHIRDWDVIGLQQYVAVVKEPAFWTVLGKTLIWTVVNVVFHVGLGVLLAVVLHQKFVVGKPAWRVLLILPWALPQYITALTWRGMFNSEYGAVNLAAMSFNEGLAQVDSRISALSGADVYIARFLELPILEWLTDPFNAFAAAILTNIWLGFPFMMVVALGGLQSIPGELYEAADVDGARAWHKFWNITVPLLRPVMIPAITLGTVWTFNNINVVWLVSNGGEPNDQTHILVSYVYEAAFSMYRFGWAAALSLIIFAILFVFTQVFLKKTGATEAAY